jgi:anti-anti-sigma factor
MPLGSAAPVIDHLPSVQLRRHGDVAFLAVSGDVDTASIRRVSGQVTPILLSPPRLLVVDLSRVTFMGSAGVELLSRVHACVVIGGGGRLRIVRASPCVQRIFEASGSTLLDELSATALGGV